ncbi:protein containing WxcM-like, C-terminal domain [Sulfurimonas gotlandica GD1]|uniref:Protein containing WxcM-like, C-terminal domain n=1 Tax=Sulfurimonas gotlandica (strain DSM 19862 / JCM 16533 / GD1) TaxID=929558 RepID=B6BKH7_SULGG|nr:FdtA/QdtA family cupin domain-containing protein [Sulfurimonas gotlandica]EDZ62266.1 bifunctional acetyl transferase/isomerase [Sulfurimonas gotlandica GD1]EHP29032.1 protein containing WxcM-like, C-terminal domain [Sulfurimonas gotlandica GD1]
MAYFISLPTFSDERGSLTVIEKILPFDIKRVFYIYYMNGQRGGHKHKKTVQALVPLNGKYKITVFDKNNEEKIYNLDSPNQCLILEPSDWHTMDGFSKNSILLVFASEYFDTDDYIYER